MTTATVNTLGLKINVNVPSSVEEFDTLAKKSGACLEQANKNVIYRNVLTQFRSDFVDRLEKETGILRKTKESGKFEKNEDGTQGAAILVYEGTEKDYFDQVLVEKNVSAESFLALAQDVASAIVFDPSASESAPAGPKKLAKQYIETAQKIIALGQADMVASKLASKLGIEVLPTEDSLARAISEDQRRKKAELAAEYTS